MRTNTITVAFAILVITVSASAQEAGQAGVTMGYPGAIGIVYQISESVAVRPEFSFSRNTSSAASGVVVPSESTTWATGLAAERAVLPGKS